MHVTLLCPLCALKVWLALRLVVNMCRLNVYHCNKSRDSLTITLKLFFVNTTYTYYKANHLITSNYQVHTNSSPVQEPSQLTLA